MYELKNHGKVLTSKSVGTGPSSYEKRIYRAAVSQQLRNTDVVDGDNFTCYLEISVRSTGSFIPVANFQRCLSNNKFCLFPFGCFW